MRLTAQELEQMKNVDIGAVSADALADVSGMAFDRNLPREERLARFVKRAVNPYCFIVLLSYFLDMSDTEIGELLNVVRTTVFRHRKSALAKIKQYLEGKADDEHR